MARDRIFFIFSSIRREDDLQILPKWKICRVASGVLKPN